MRAKEAAQDDAAAYLRSLHSAVAQNTQPFAAPIPWRKPNPRYNANEVYFDIEESIDAILDRKGKILSSEVWGRINCNAKLSGNPDLLLSFSSPKLAENCSFHPCVRYKRWMKDRVLSFIPPDGAFKLMDYQVAKPQGGVERPIAIPLALKPSMQLTPDGGKFQLTLSSRCTARPIENIVVSIYLGEAATGVSATATGDSRSVVSQGVGTNGGTAAIGGVGGGTWEFDPNTGRLTWSVSSLTSNERPPSLTGTFTTRCVISYSRYELKLISLQAAMQPAYPLRLSTLHLRSGSIH